MADTITVTGSRVDELSKISPWFRERADEQGGKAVVFHKRDFPASKTKWQFLTDLAKGRKMGYVENDKIVVDSSKGYTPSKLKRAADYFLIGKKGEELKTLKSTGYLGKNPIQRRKTLSHGQNKPRSAPKAYDRGSDLEERGFHREDYGGRRTRKNGKKLRTTRRR
jgi:hypothetical protein